MIEYIPKEFHDVKLGFYENKENICTPYFPGACSKIKNQIAINVPQKIICNKIDLIIPLCGVYMIPERRGLKYADLSTPIIHIRKIGEETWFQGEIVDLFLENTNPYIPPDYYIEEEKRQQRIKDAQKYSDDELIEKEGLSFGKAINVNLAEYINLSFQEGIYEVYVSKSGLESNHVKVEIIFKE